MKRAIPTLIVLLLFAAGTMDVLQAQEREPVFQDRPLSAWINSIRHRDEDMDLAFDAIKTLGPYAAAAVPELTKIVSEPFTSIRVGTDNAKVVSQRLSELQLRADAVDSLGAIGPAASSAADPLIKWALTKRVIPDAVRTQQDYKTLVNLIAIDVQERMRVVGVVSGFAVEAAPALVVLINSSVEDERKLAVAIIQEHVLPISVNLLKSDDCERRELGVTLLMDLWSVVPSDDLTALKKSSACTLTGQ